VTANIIVPPTNAIVEDPNGVSFKCTADGLPRPTISWVRVQNNVAMGINNNTDFAITLNNDANIRQVTSVLTVASVRPSLAGELICNASNIVGYDS